MTKSEETSEPSSIDPNDRSLLAEKAFEFKSEDDMSDDEVPVRKTPSVKIKLKKQTSNDHDSSVTPPPKRRYVRNSTAAAESTTVSEQEANGSTGSRQQQTPISKKESPTVNGNSTGKKRGRPRLSKPSVISTNGDIQTPSSPSVTPKPTITKPQAFTNTVRIDYFFFRINNCVHDLF